jgi:hypothetical protein
MEDLLDNLKSNDKLRYIADDGAGDVALWNKEIARYFRGKTLWVPFLFFPFCPLVF